MSKKSAEIHIILDGDGVNCVQIKGPIETHPQGHDFYLQIRDLVEQLDSEIRARISSDRGKVNA